MVTPGSLETKGVLNEPQAALLRALSRAADEQLVPYRIDGSSDVFGLARLAGHRWEFTKFTVAFRGDVPGGTALRSMADVERLACDCPSALHGSICKHTAGRCVRLEARLPRQAARSPPSSCAVS